MSAFGQERTLSGGWRSPEFSDSCPDHLYAHDQSGNYRCSRSISASNRGFSRKDARSLSFCIHDALT